MDAVAWVGCMLAVTDQGNRSMDTVIEPERTYNVKLR
jgi:hypothetical protein